LACLISERAFKPSSEKTQGSLVAIASSSFTPPALSSKAQHFFGSTNLFSIKVYGILENELNGEWYHEETPSFQNVTNWTFYQTTEAEEGHGEYIVFYDSTKRFKINIQFCRS